MSEAAKRVILLGAGGQLGTDIVRVFEKSSVRVTPLTRKEFDADRDSVDGSLAQYADHRYLINCIAYHKTDDCENDPDRAFALNGTLVLNLARFCTDHEMTFIHLSTDYVFDGAKRAAYVETDRPAPLNVYGASKLAGEELARAYAPKHFIFRVSSLFGSKPSDNPNVNFVEKMVDAARGGKDLKVINDQFMSPTHARDAARAILAVIEREVTEYGLFHACNSGSCSWFEFASKIFELTGQKADLSPIGYTEFHTLARRPQYCSMDNARLSRYYVMKPWTEALKEYLTLKGYLIG